MAKSAAKRKSSESPDDRMMDLAIAAVKSGNWIIRADYDGMSPNSNARGFRWNAIGEWTTAPDFNTKAGCRGGLHGQDYKNGGYIEGRRMTFCEHRGGHVVVDSSKVKVHEARILLVNRLPPQLKIEGDLKLSGTQIAVLPEGLHVGGYLDLSGTQIAALPEGLHVGGSLYLVDTQIAALPEGLHVGGSLYLVGTQIAALPEGLHVGGSLYLSGTQIAQAQVPKKLKSKCIW